VQVSVLGRVGLSIAGSEVQLPAGRPLWAFAVLALAGGAPVPVDRLVAALWGEDAPSTARNALQVHVSTLRSRLRPHDIGVSLTPAGYRLDIAADCIDIVRFEALAGAGLAAVADGRPDVASGLLSQALDLFDDQALANVQDAPFAAQESDRLQLRRSAVRRARLEADLELGLGSTLVDEAAGAAAADPYDEKACGHVMLTLYRAGQPAAALEAFRIFRARLDDELGLEPGPALAEASTVTISACSLTCMSRTRRAAPTGSGHG